MIVVGVGAVAKDAETVDGRVEPNAVRYCREEK
jgi:hypothetical protein